MTHIRGKGGCSSSLFLLSFLSLFSLLLFFSLYTMALAKGVACALTAARRPLASPLLLLRPLSATRVALASSGKQHTHSHQAFTGPWTWHARAGWQRAREQALPRSRLMAAQSHIEDEEEKEEVVEKMKSKAVAAAAGATSRAPPAYVTMVKDAEEDEDDGEAAPAGSSSSSSSSRLVRVLGEDETEATDAGFGEHTKQSEDDEASATSAADVRRSAPPVPPLRPPFSVVSAASRDNSAEPTAKPLVAASSSPAAATATAPDVHNNPDVAQTVFESSWRRVEREIGAGNMRFPKEIIFLNGAPGSGKGTMAEYFVRERHITHVATSDLLDTPEARAIKASGRLVNDSEVFHLVLKTLLQPKVRRGWGGVGRSFPK